MSDHLDGGSATAARKVVDLSRAEAMRLLGSIGHGRVVFTRRWRPGSGVKVT